MHFFHVRTSKSGANIWCFLHFDFEICSAPQRCAFSRHLNLQKWCEDVVLCAFWLGNMLRATTACTFSTSQLPKVVRHWGVLHMLPQRRALFRHLNFQKCSGTQVPCTFWLGNVLRATTACTFSTSEPPKVARTCGALCILTWKCASRHNSVHFFISHLASWFRTRRFSEPTFRPSGGTAGAGGPAALETSPMVNAFWRFAGPMERDPGTEPRASGCSGCIMPNAHCMAMPMRLKCCILASSFGTSCSVWDFGLGDEGALAAFLLPRRVISLDMTARSSKARGPSASSYAAGNHASSWGREGNSTKWVSTRPFFLCRAAFKSLMKPTWFFSLPASMPAT